MAAEHKQITLENCGPISRAVIPIPEEGGVVVLQGHEGLGKTTALEAINELGREDGGKIVKRDDSPRAIVEGLGVTLTVNKSTRREGELIVSAIGGTSLHQIVDPKIKDPKAADAARLKGIIEVSRTSIGFDDFKGCGLTETEIERALKGLLATPVAAVQAIKEALNSKGLAIEKEVERKTGEYEGLSKRLREENVSAIDQMRPDSDIDEEIQKLIRERDAANREADYVEEHRAAYDKAKEGGGKEHRTVEAIAADAKAVAEEIVKLESLLSDAKAVLQKYREEHIATTAAAKASSQASDLISAFELKMGTNWSEQAAAKTQEIDALRQEKDRNARARVRLQDAEIMERLGGEMEAGKKQAKDLRKAAKDADLVLRKLLPEGSPLKIVDGLLVMTTTEGEEAFSRLSAGEKWKVAIDIAVAAVPNGLVVIPQEAWDGISPEVRKEIAAYARGRKVVCITAESTADTKLVPRVL